MKVLFISRRFYPEIKGGGQISAYHIAEALADQKNDVFVCTFTDNKTSVKKGTITVYRIHMPKLPFKRLSNMDYMYYQMARLSSRYIEKIKPDIIHLLNFESIPLSSVYYKLRYKISLVATVNGPLFGCFTGDSIDYKEKTCIKCSTVKRCFCSLKKWGRLRGSLFYSYSLWYMSMLRFSYKYVDKFVAISNAMIPLLENMGVPKKKAITIPNPIGNVGYDKNLTREIKKRFRNKKILLCVARLAVEKGVHYAIESLKHLPDKYILLVAGWGDYKTKLKELAKKLNLKNRVFFVGRVPYEKIGSYYKAAFALVHLPTFYEPFGRNIIESMSFGTPVLGYSIAGIKEIIDDRKNSLLLTSRKSKDIAEHIKTLENKEFYSKLSREAVKTVRKRYSDRIIGKKYNDVYKRILNKKV